MQGNNRKRLTIKSDSKMRKRRRARARPTIGKAIDRRVGVYSNAGYQVMKDLNSLRRFINAEFHYIDKSGAGVSMSTTATFQLLNGAQVGDTAVTRTGQSIRMDHSDLRFYINGNATSIQTLSRVIVVLDKQPNAAIFASGDLLEQVTPVSPYLVANENRFVILYDETFALSTNGQGVIYKVVGLNSNQHTTYNTGNAGTIADITSNSLYLLFFSDQVTNTPTITYYNRMWFIDN